MAEILEISIESLCPIKEFLAILAIHSNESSCTFYLYRIFLGT